MLAGHVLVRRLHRIGPGFSWLVGGVTTGAGLLAVLVGAPAGAVPLVVGLLLVADARRHHAVLDVVALTAAVGATVAVAIDAGGGALWVARTITGAALLGTVTVAMTVGHWYLIDPRLPRVVIQRVDQALIAAASLE